MNLQLILVVVAALVAVGMLVMALAGPSVSGVKKRRLSSVRDRHAASTEAVVAAQMRKTIQARSGGVASISNLMPRRELMALTPGRVAAEESMTVPGMSGRSVSRIQIGTRASRQG